MLTRFSNPVLALTLAAMCAGITCAAAQTAKKMTLVQMHPAMGVGEEVFLYAVPKQLGFFKTEGLDVDIQNSQTGMISAQVLESKNAQVGTTAAEAIMAVREQGGDLISFFNLKRNAGTFLIVPPDSPIQKLEDLKGKTIAVNKGSAYESRMTSKARLAGRSRHSAPRPTRCRPFWSAAPMPMSPAIPPSPGRLRTVRSLNCRISIRPVWCGRRRRARIPRNCAIRLMSPSNA